ncbi:MAG: hypothetical protein GY849_21990, partial [Deltaproteobacteria bacterium]|nr:hypothetical protein [Deltaproteobacteria bacterium]
MTVTIDTERVRGGFEKKAIVWSNDLERRSIVLFLRGEVKPHIAIEPGGYVSLRGIEGEVPGGRLDIVNHNKSPIKIAGIDNDLPARIAWRLKEIKPGFVYKLEIEDIPKT